MSWCLPFCKWYQWWICCTKLCFFIAVQIIFYFEISSCPCICFLEELRIIFWFFFLMAKISGEPCIYIYPKCMMWNVEVKPNNWSLEYTLFLKKFILSSWCHVEYDMWVNESTTWYREPHKRTCSTRILVFILFCCKGWKWFNKKVKSFYHPQSLNFDVHERNVLNFQK